MYSRRFLTVATAFSAMVGHTVLAAPSRINLIPELKSLQAFGRRDGNQTGPTPDEICNGHPFDDADPDSRAAAWADTGAGDLLNQWVTDNGWVDWVRRMDDDLMHNGASSRECSYADSCDPPDGCMKYAHKDVGAFYWILLAASTLHEGFHYFSDNIQNDMIYDSLDVDSMLAAFSAELPSGDFNIFGLMSGALGVAGALTGAASPLMGTIFAITNSAAGMANAFASQEVDITADVKAQMAGSFKATMDAIERLCDVALTGNPDSPDTLPNQTGDWSQALARFFDEGRFLVNDIAGEMQSMLDNAHGNFQKAMLNVIMRDSGYFFYVNTGITSSDDCAGVGAGAFWVQDSMCIDLMRFINDGNTISENTSDDLISAMMDNWGYDFGYAYSLAWDCAVAHPDGDGAPDPSAIPTDGSLPECWYNIPIVQGYHVMLDDEYWINNDDGDINTSGREYVDSPWWKE